MQGFSEISSTILLPIRGNALLVFNLFIFANPIFFSNILGNVFMVCIDELNYGTYKFSKNDFKIITFKMYLLVQWNTAAYLTITWLKCTNYNLKKA